MTVLYSRNRLFPPAYGRTVFDIGNPRKSVSDDIRFILAIADLVVLRPMSRCVHDLTTIQLGHTDARTVGDRLWGDTIVKVGVREQADRCVGHRGCVDAHAESSFDRLPRISVVRFSEVFSQPVQRVARSGLCTSACCRRCLTRTSPGGADSR